MNCFVLKPIVKFDLHFPFGMAWNHSRLGMLPIVTAWSVPNHWTDWTRIVDGSKCTRSAQCERSFGNAQKRIHNASVHSHLFARGTGHRVIGIGLRPPSAFQSRKRSIPSSSAKHWSKIWPCLTRKRQLLLDSGIGWISWPYRLTLTTISPMLSAPLL